MSTLIWITLAAIGFFTVICCLFCTVGVVLCCRYAPRIDDYGFVDSDAGDDRQRGTDASMDYEHEVATDGGTDADLWSHR